MYTFLLTLLALASPWTLAESVTDNAGPLRFAHVWPKHPYGTHGPSHPPVVTSGEPSEILIGALNTGEVPQTVYYISAAFANPQNLSQVWRNITGHRYEIVIGQNQEATLPFALEVLAEPQEVGLLVYVHHQGNGKTIKQTLAFQEVVKVIDKQSVFDLQSLSVYVLIAALVFGLGYLRSGASSAPSIKKVTKSAPSKEELSFDASNMDWIPEHLKKGEGKVKKRSK